MSLGVPQPRRNLDGKQEHVSKTQPAALCASRTFALISSRVITNPAAASCSAARAHRFNARSSARARSGSGLIGYLGVNR